MTQHHSAINNPHATPEEIVETLVDLAEFKGLAKTVGAKEDDLRSIEATIAELKERILGKCDS